MAVSHVREVLGEETVSERRVCRVIGQPRSTQRREPKVADDEEALTERVVELASKYGRYGYRRVTGLLWAEGFRVNHKRVERIWRREGWPANHKLIYRFYKEEALSLRRKVPRRRVSAARRENAPAPSRCNETWSMDFMADQLYSGRSIRILTIADNYSRESLALRAGFGLTGEDVAGVLNEVVRQRGVPTSIRVDNGTEFTSKAMDQWA